MRQKGISKHKVEKALKDGKVGYSGRRQKLLLLGASWCGVHFPRHPCQLCEAKAHPLGDHGGTWPCFAKVMICQMQLERNVHFAMRWLPQFALDTPTEKEAKVGLSGD